MAKNDIFDPDEKIRLLRALAFQIHRKRAGDEVLAELLEQESRGGRRRLLRPASDAVTAGGFIAALQILGMIGEEAALVMTVVVESNDHRLLSGALGKLADYMDAQQR